MKPQITKEQAWNNFTKGIKTIQRYAYRAVIEYNSLVDEDYRFPLGRTQKPKWMGWSSSHGEDEYKNDYGEGKPTKSDILEHFTGCIFIDWAFIDYNNYDADLEISVVFNVGQWESTIRIGNTLEFKYQDEYFLTSPSPKTVAKKPELDENAQSWLWLCNQ